MPAHSNPSDVDTILPGPLTIRLADDMHKLNTVETKSLRWYQGLSRYQWWVFAVGAMAWLFDCTDQRLFMLARSPALADLLGRAQNDPQVVDYATYATAATMAGWGVGGLLLGILGD